jgi:hypothetical protein
VAEQLGLEQRRGQRPAVDDDERTCSRRPKIVDRARDQLLAGARLALNQHRSGEGRHGSHAPRDLTHRVARDHHPRQGLDGGARPGFA